MNTINWWLVGLVLLFGLSKNLRNELIDKFVLIGSLLEKLGSFLRRDFVDEFFPRTTRNIIPFSSIKQSTSESFDKINRWFNNQTNSLDHHEESMTNAIETDPNIRPWRIFGYIFQSILFFLFIYADSIQLVNNYAMIFPQHNQVPNFLQNLVLSLIMSSIGIAVSASIILGDFAGITHFGRWNNLKGGFRVVVIVLSAFSLFSILIIDLLQGLSRVQAISDVVKLLDPNLLDQIKLYAAFSSSLVIIPMIIITFLLFEGIKGFLILYLLLVKILILFINLIHLLINGIIYFFAYGLTYIIDLFIRLLLFISVILIMAVSLIFLGGGIGSVSFFELIKSALNIFYSPLDFVVGVIGKYLFKIT